MTRWPACLPPIVATRVPPSPHPCHYCAHAHAVYWAVARGPQRRPARTARHRGCGGHGVRRAVGRLHGQLGQGALLAQRLVETAAASPALPWTVSGCRIQILAPPKCSGLQYALLQRRGWSKGFPANSCTKEEKRCTLALVMSFRRPTNPDCDTAMLKLCHAPNVSVFLQQLRRRYLEPTLPFKLGCADTLDTI